MEGIQFGGRQGSIAWLFPVGLNGYAQGSRHSCSRPAARGQLLPNAPKPQPFPIFISLALLSLIRMMAHCLKSQWIVPFGISYAHRDI